MTAQIIDGKLLAEQLRGELKARTQELVSQGITPGLAVVLVGNNPASQLYVKNKVRACEEVGFYSRLEQLPADASEGQLLDLIERLNRDHRIHGILVQLPLPAQMREQQVIERIAAHKDVDGFHLANAGALLVGANGFKPCTPYGCMKMLESIGYDLKGKNAVVVGRSNIVGKPMALLLLEQNATVTICHSKTEDLAQTVRKADVVIAAVGRPNMITADMIKPGAVVIDVGINRYPDEHPQAGKVCGDVDFESVKKVASYITPVPGGVGPMTITMLLFNTLQAAQQAQAAKA